MPAIQCLQGTVSPWLKRPSSETNHSSTLVEVRSEWNCTSTPSYACMSRTQTHYLYLYQLKQGSFQVSNAQFYSYHMNNKVQIKMY